MNRYQAGEPPPRCISKQPDAPGRGPRQRLVQFAGHAWLVAALCAMPAAAQTLSQSERALSGVRALVASGELPPNSVLRLGFKQGNIRAYLGTNLELQKEWELATDSVLETRIIPQATAQTVITTTPGIDLTVARNHEFPELLPLRLIEDLTPLFEEFGFTLDNEPRQGYIRPDLQAYLGERVAAIPADGDVAIMFLRRDLLEDPAERAAYRAATGHALAPPDTWDEYERQIRFFHRPQQGLYGTAEERDPADAWMFWLPRYLSMASPYQPLFDARMRPLLDSPAGVAATRGYAAAVRYSPPGITDAGNDYSYTLPLFLQGKVYATISTIAAARLMNGAGSALRGRFLAVPLPGTWVGDRLVRRNTVIYGNNLVIPSSAANRKLAFLYAMWITSPEVSARSVGVSGGFTDPYRWHHLSDPRIVEVYSRQALDVFAASWPVALPPGTGLPGDSEYLSVLDTHLTAAARGDLTPEAAMQRTAAAWERITERRGRAEQVRHWQALQDQLRGLP